MKSVRRSDSRLRKSSARLRMRAQDRVTELCTTITPTRHCVSRACPPRLLLDIARIHELHRTKRAAFGILRQHSTVVVIAVSASRLRELLVALALGGAHCWRVMKKRERGEVESSRKMKCPTGRRCRHLFFGPTFDGDITRRFTMAPSTSRHRHCAQLARLEQLCAVGQRRSSPCKGLTLKHRTCSSTRRAR